VVSLGVVDLGSVGSVCFSAAMGCAWLFGSCGFVVVGECRMNSASCAWFLLCAWLLSWAVLRMVLVLWLVFVSVVVVGGLVVLGA